MYVLLMTCEAAGRRSRIHLADEDGRLVYSTDTMQAALAWILDHGELSVTAMTDVGPELFLIEPCEGLQLTLPSYSLRRAFHGRCCDPPPLPGLQPDQPRAARILEDQQNDQVEKRHRRRKWNRQPAGPAASDDPS